MRIRHLGECPLTGRDCIITAEYREEKSYRSHRHIKESAVCSLGLCDARDTCREYNHFPPEYRLR